MTWAIARIWENQMVMPTNCRKKAKEASEELVPSPGRGLDKSRERSDQDGERGDNGGNKSDSGDTGQ
jgi:hypothetical protein